MDWEKLGLPETGRSIIAAVASNSLIVEVAPARVVVDSRQTTGYGNTHTAAVIEAVQVEHSLHVCGRDSVRTGGVHSLQEFKHIVNRSALRNSVKTSICQAQKFTLLCVTKRRHHLARLLVLRTQKFEIIVSIPKKSDR